MHNKYSDIKRANIIMISNKKHLGNRYKLQFYKESLMVLKSRCPRGSSSTRQHSCVTEEEDE